jgi:hypothetical protein
MVAVVLVVVAQSKPLALLEQPEKGFAGGTACG